MSIIPEVWMLPIEPLSEIQYLPILMAVDGKMLMSTASSYNIFTVNNLLENVTIIGDYNAHCFDFFIRS